jgi:cytoskeletal protein CcmA (bactofilin family)
LTAPRTLCYFWDHAAFTKEARAAMFGKRAVPQSGKTSDLTAFVDESAEIEGRFSFSGTVMLNGRLTGEITSSDTLIIGEKAVIKASIRAGAVLISGEVLGNVVCSDRVELRGTARVFGDVEAPVVVVEEGVVFEGHCRMTKPKSVDAAPAARDLSLAAMKG